MLCICIVFWLLMLLVSLKYRINSAKNLLLTGNLCHKGFWAFQTLYFIWNFSIFVYIIAAHFQKLFELFVFLLSQISLEYLMEKSYAICKRDRVFSGLYLTLNIKLRKQYSIISYRTKTMSINIYYQNNYAQYSKILIYKA